jgi:hypothetical protein
MARFDLFNVQFVRNLTWAIIFLMFTAHPTEAAHEKRTKTPTTFLSR